jgi:hypothetical protein
MQCGSECAGTTGAADELVVERRGPGRTPPEALAIVGECGAAHSNVQIAKMLNDAGLRTGSNLRFTPRHVGGVRGIYQIFTPRTVALATEVAAPSTSDRNPVVPTSPAPALGRSCTNCATTRRSQGPARRVQQGRRPRASTAFANPQNVTAFTPPSAASEQQQLSPIDQLASRNLRAEVARFTSLNLDLVIRMASKDLALLVDPVTWVGPAERVEWLASAWGDGHPAWVVAEDRVGGDVPLTAELVRLAGNGTAVNSPVGVARSSSVSSRASLCGPALSIAQHGVDAARREAIHRWPSGLLPLVRGGAVTQGRRVRCRLVREGRAAVRNGLVRRSEHQDVGGWGEVQLVRRVQHAVAAAQVYASPV